MLDQYLNSNNNVKGEIDDGEEDNCVNEKYVMSENEGNVQQGNNFTSIQPLDTLISTNRRNPSENMPLKLNEDNTIPSNLKSNNKENINNMIINSTPSNRSSNSNNSIDNYIKMENLYLQDGKCNTTGSNVNNEVRKEEENNNLDFLSRNEQQIKMLQEKGQSNVETENNNTEKEKIDSMITECKLQLRNEKEMKLKEKVVENLKPKIQNEIYKKEYNNIVADIKKSIEAELNEELTKKNNEEIAFIKKKQNYIQKMKEDEIEKEIRQKCQDELEDELNREITLKQKEMTLKYMQRYEAYKKKIDKELGDEFETKRKAMTKQIDEIKSQIYRSKCSENIKISKINAMKKNIKHYHEKNLKCAEQVEKIINSKDIDENEDDNCQYNDENIDNNLTTHNENNVTELIKENDDYLVDMYKENVKKQKVNKSLRVDNSINLAEINNKIKAVNNNNIPNSSLRSIKPTSTLIQASAPISPINSDPKVAISNKTSTEFQKINQQIVTKKSETQMSKLVQSNSKQKMNQSYNSKIQTLSQTQKNIFYSLQVDKSTPTTVEEFGKYLLSHIEKEENYKMLFLSEIKKIKNQIVKIFKSEKSTDHCLTDYMLELWDKLEISFTIRYQIMKQLLKMKSLPLYQFLDKETEYLTEYYQITEEIFKLIKQRETLKCKLQKKLNRNELLPEDKNGLDDITREVAVKIKTFKNKYKNLDIIWKGLRYEWFMNYEKWFYENNLQNN